ncbi:MAG: mechanosensitive ion channel [Thermostichales cyanobacterium BF4_bins_65]
MGRWIVAAVVMGISLGSSPAWGQLSRLDALLPNTTRTTSTLIYVDGRPLFAISAPASGDPVSPVEQRRQVIETELQRQADQALPPEAIQVSWELDRASGLPVVSVNGRYLLTVTTLDAQLQGTDPQTWAGQLSEQIRRALEQAYRERQQPFLLRQGGIGLAVLVGMGVIHLGLERWRRRIQQLHDNPPSHPGDPQSLMRHHRRQVSLELQQRLLRLADISLWIGGTTVILGLFPHSRWLQVLLVGVLRGPFLRLVGVGVGTYLLVRLSALSIDQFFSVLTQEGWVPGRSSRLVNRMRTFSSVSKGVAGSVITGAGVLLGASTIGINIGPLLAGAGIVGLAISFGAQNLIRDIINGLLILIEDQYAEGDVIVLDQVGGLVERMNLRITQLRNNEGMLITIPNGAISIVRNLSNGWARVDLGIHIGYQADPDQALQVIQEVADGMVKEPHWQRKILSVEVLGIDDLSERGILIRVWIKVLPLEQWSVAREYRRRLKYALDQAGIPVGLPQQELWFRTPLNLAVPEENWLKLLRQQQGLQSGSAPALGD